MGLPASNRRFETGGPGWSARAGSGELRAVFSPNGTPGRNLFLHEVSLYAARRALALAPAPGVLLDFGCGTGRMLRFFAAHGWKVIGTEITPEMLDEARRIGLPPGTEVHLTDGIRIPCPDASVDMIWVCGVLKYALFEPGASCRGGALPEGAPSVPFQPVADQIAREMFRVLKPGGRVVNHEVYVDAPPEAFRRDFEAAGFVTEQVRMLQRHFEPFMSRLQAPGTPPWLVRAAARLFAARRFHFDDPGRPSEAMRDYFIVWTRPRT